MPRKLFSVVVATDVYHGIASRGRIPWNMPADMHFFKALTTETPDLVLRSCKQPPLRNAVIMGRKTWETLPHRYLPGRENIVLSRTLSSAGDPIRVLSSLESALEYCNTNPDIWRVFVIGGGDVYAEASNHLQLGNVYHSLIPEKWNCDTFSPQWQNMSFLNLRCQIDVDASITLAKARRMVHQEHQLMWRDVGALVRKKPGNTGPYFQLNIYRRDYPV